MPSDDEGGGAAAAPAHERKVGLMGMIVMGFFWVCGGMSTSADVRELLQALPIAATAAVERVEQNVGEPFRH